MAIIDVLLARLAALHAALMLVMVVAGFTAVRWMAGVALVPRASPWP